MKGSVALLHRAVKSSPVQEVLGPCAVIIVSLQRGTFVGGRTKRRAAAQCGGSHANEATRLRVIGLVIMKSHKCKWRCGCGWGGGQDHVWTLDLLSVSCWVLIFAGLTCGESVGGSVAERGLKGDPVTGQCSVHTVDRTRLQHLSPGGLTGCLVLPLWPLNFVLLPVTEENRRFRFGQRFPSPPSRPLQDKH